MSATNLLDLKTLTAENVASLFSLADRLSAEKPIDRERFFRHRHGLTAPLIFLEPSTRTRLSFESACGREGVTAIVFDGGAGTSLEKGETAEDTILNIAAMLPAFIVIRSGDDLDFRELAKKVKVPIINAGWGRVGHPTQALLDAYAIHRLRGPLGQQRILLIGDVRHSRVAMSHLELAKNLGYQIALCGPDSFLPASAEVQIFRNLREGLQWATVAMALRVQVERHQAGTDLADYHQNWGLNKDTLKDFGPHGLIMHPGPVNWGVELAPEISTDRRCAILDQVRGGVLVRQALIRQILEAL